MNKELLYDWIPASAGMAVGEANDEQGEFRNDESSVRAGKYHSNQSKLCDLCVLCG